MVQSETTSERIQQLIKRTDKSTSNKSNEVVICASFQRGDDTGVWKGDMKINYIESLMKGYPTGLITLVKDHKDNSSNEPWFILDGANRVRTLKEFMDNKFTINIKTETVLYKDLIPEVRAEFNSTLISTQRITIEPTDEDCTISNMFTGLNTSSMNLTDGELLKAHGWKNDCCDIQLAKVICNRAGAKYTPNEFEKSIKEKWEDTFGKTKSNKRYKDLHRIQTFIVSAKKGVWTFLDAKKQYKLLKEQINPRDKPFTQEEKENISVTFTVLKDIIHGIGQQNENIIQLDNYNIPKLKTIFPIWACICENKQMSYNTRKQIIQYYKTCPERDFYEIMGGTHDNHLTQAKLNRFKSKINID